MISARRFARCSAISAPSVIFGQLVNVDETTSALTDRLKSVTLQSLPASRPSVGVRMVLARPLAIRFSIVVLPG
jgi:hypothetical protein